MARKRLLKLYKSFVHGTEKNAIIQIEDIMLCYPTHKTVQSTLGEYKQFPKIFITSVTVKHLYDKKPAEEFYTVLDSIHLICKYPDHVYANKDGKRGSFCFVKKIREHNYLCSLEYTNGNFYIVTCFRIRKIRYLYDYDLLWSWKDGEPSS